MSSAAAERARRQRNGDHMRAVDRARYARSPKKRLSILAARRRREYPAPTRVCPARCEICGRPPGAKALSLDHDHRTFTFRGWLCTNCNRGLGNFRDSPALMRSAIAYIEIQGLL